LELLWGFQPTRQPNFHQLIWEQASKNLILVLPHRRWLEKKNPERNIVHLVEICQDFGPLS
jgi:hypothetical protein